MFHSVRGSRDWDVYQKLGTRVSGCMWLDLGVRWRNKIYMLQTTSDFKLTPYNELFVFPRKLYSKGFSFLSRCQFLKIHLQKNKVSNFYFSLTYGRHMNFSIWNLIAINLNFKIFNIYGEKMWFDVHHHIKFDFEGYNDHFMRNIKSDYLMMINNIYSIRIWFDRYRTGFHSHIRMIKKIHTC